MDASTLVVVAVIFIFAYLLFQIRTLGAKVDQLSRGVGVLDDTINHELLPTMGESFDVITEMKDSLAAIQGIQESQQEALINLLGDGTQKQDNSDRDG